MAVSEAKAFELAVQLTFIPDCPRGDAAVERLAHDLMRLLLSDDEAVEIVTEACDRWERWKGNRGLIDLIESRRPAPVPSNQAKDFGPRPKPDCAICADWGYFGRPGGRVEWCTCPAGSETQAKAPGLVEVLNRKKTQPLHEAAAIEPPRRITQADIDQAFEERQDRTGQLIADARDTLADPAAAPDRQEIAREILRRFEVQ